METHNTEDVTLMEEVVTMMMEAFKELCSILEGNQISKDLFNFEKSTWRLYSGVYSLCRVNSNLCNSMMYSTYGDLLKEYIHGTLLQSLRLKQGEFFLKELVTRWAHYKLIVGWLSNFFGYLERQYIPGNSIPTLSDVGINCFTHMVYGQIMCAIASPAVISLIDKERDGMKIDRTLVMRVFRIFVELGKGSMDLYEKDFEKPMLDDARDYYSRKASIWISECSCPEFMAKVEECLIGEEKRGRCYMYHTTEKKLVSRVENELLVVHETELLEKESSGLKSLLRDNKVDDLARIYRLFSRVHDGLKLISILFKEHVTCEGMALVKQAGDHESSKKVENKDHVAAGLLQEAQVLLIGRFIELHDKCLGYVKDCFQNDSLFFRALKEAFEVFCNKSITATSPAELLAVYCDFILKRGGIDHGTTFEQVVKLFTHVNEKDLFAEFHRARRLLFDKNDSDEHEKCLMAKLKQHCGGLFTSKMEGMVTDLTIFRDMQKSFEEFIQSNSEANPGIDLTVTVLTTGAWPSYKTCNLNLPPEMLRCVEVFEEFYRSRTKRRRLSWVYSLGTCKIIGHFEPKTMELLLNTFQAAALLLFNSSDRMSYSEIKDQLGLTDEDVNRVLHSLSCAKYKILNKEPDSENISETDYFSFNSKFTDRMRRIKVPLPQVDERKKVVEGVAKDRRYAVDAAIVRIMKHHKVLGHQQLMSECDEYLGRIFKPDFKLIKKRIEDLIGREYLERDANDSNVYRYIA
ncbi:hypothetical protein J5N97_006731 [Dioscorea zingiberensis]|uniref:Cullin family profile domain-containing protein n=1 Tax=Dioscorea zingiberensis TaxID=325984 RepID=A0A9D5DCM8_9LILI|nr:hypothetical protein J5N97_006731 [Dioscorea zingiberensis]